MTADPQAESLHRPVTFPYTPHPGQLQIHAARNRRFRTVCCGRRWGKTMFAAAELLDRGGSEAAGDYGWIAPTYLIADRGIDAMRQFGAGFVTFTGKAPVVATFDGLRGPVRVFFLSTDNPDSILGFGFHGLVLDEAARIPFEVWTRNIRPTLSDHRGWCLQISTPLGRNWFFDEWTRGRSGDPEHGSWTFPSHTNPHFPPDEWRLAKQTLPEDVFRQEYEAEFLEDSAGVFRGIEGCLVPAAPAEPTGPVVVGADIAKHTDYTVLIAMDSLTGACLDKERFNTLDWPIQKERIVAFARKWNARIILDATGKGDPLYDEIVRLHPAVEPVVFTNPVKVEMIQRLSVAIEQRQVTWPRAWTDVTDELKRYEYAFTANGRVTYGAPSGFHDDCVIALALANSARVKRLQTCPPIPFPVPPRERMLRTPLRRLPL